MSKKDLKFTGGLNLFVPPHEVADNQAQTLENMEIRPTSIDGNLTFYALTARYSYKRLHGSDLGIIPRNLVEFVQVNSGVGVKQFTGAGLNDATFGGTYVGSTVLSTYEVEIDATGTPDTFKWRKDAGGYTTGVAITGSAQTLAEGVTITFAATTGHTLGNKWIVNVAPSGTKWLVVGGLGAGTTFVIKALQDGQTTPIQVSSQATVSAGVCSFLLFNNYLYYTDGNKAWRKWDGLDDTASGFTTITKYGIQHKSKAIYLNDVTNNKPHRFWVSNTGTPETVPAANSFDVGESTDALVAGIDQTERCILIKEKSMYGFYLAPTLTESTILRGDQWKGSVSPLGVVWGSFGTYIYSADAGIQSISGLYIEPSVLQLYNKFKGFQNTAAALMFREDQVLISTKSDSGQSKNNRIYLVDILDEENLKVYQYNIPIVVFCQNKGILTFDKRLKAIEDDGTNRYIVELDQRISTAETNISCLVKTKDFSLEDIGRFKKLNYIVLEFNAPNTVNAVTLKIYGDGVLKETLTFTPTATGHNIKKFLPKRHLSFGKHITFQIEYTQPASNTDRFALFDSSYFDYDTEQRVD